MKTASEIITLANTQNVHLWVDGGALRYRAQGELPDGLKSGLKQHKAEIIQLLAGKPGGNAAARPLPKFCRGEACNLYYHSMGRHWCFRTLSEMRWKFIDTENMGDCPGVKNS